MALLMATAMANLGCAHVPTPERKTYLVVENVSNIEFQEDTRAIGGAGVDAYCNEMQKQCYTKCMRRKPDLPSVEKYSGKHKEHCTTKCLDEFMDCVKKMEEIERQESQSKAIQFPSINEALAWLKEHAPEAPPGTQVVVAGVGFVVAVMGGALFLVPI